MILLAWLMLHELFNIKLYWHLLQSIVFQVKKSKGLCSCYIILPFMKRVGLESIGVSFGPISTSELLLGNLYVISLYVISLYVIVPFKIVIDDLSKKKHKKINLVWM